MKSVLDVSTLSNLTGQLSKQWRQGDRRKTAHRQQPKRRIAMISTHGYVAAIPPLGAADTGGQVVYVLEISKKLAQLGYEVDIWTRRFEDQGEVEEVSKGVRIIRVPCGGREFIPKEYLYLTLNVWVANALHFIRLHGLKYEFINSHYWDAGVAGRDLAEDLGLPHLHTPHSLGIWKMRQMETDFAHNATKFEQLYNFNVRNREERLLYVDADVVIATTPVQTDMLGEDYSVPLEKIRMVTPGYDEHRFSPVCSARREALRQKFGFDGKVVLSLGRLARNKGYDLLIRAFPQVFARVPDARLHLAIGGNVMSAREELVLDECRGLVVQLGLQERVNFSGFVREEDLPDIYRAADVFVLGSRYEPFGMTAIEAMACGTPVVATTHGGFWRVLEWGVNGFFADTFDPVDFGFTISRPLLSPALATSVSWNGAAHARSSFTWDGIARQLVNAFAQCKAADAPTQPVVHGPANV